ncbi:hypothetical protein [Profundibacter sp.]|uniref:hypothetical protein n=1 Tax=Profundibacter sp. TaxID=3101071 RepID=UPI003D1057C1
MGGRNLASTESHGLMQRSLKLRSITGHSRNSRVITACPCARVIRAKTLPPNRPASASSCPTGKSCEAALIKLSVRVKPAIAAIIRAMPRRLALAWVTF